MEFRRKRVVGAVAALALVAGFLAACGGDDDDANASDTTGTTAASGATTTTAGSGGTDDAAWQQVLDAANQEGTVTVYSVGTPPANEALVAAFEQAYPDIHVDMQGLKEPENIQRLQAEHDSGSSGGDLTINTGVNFLQQSAAEDGWFVDLTGPDVAAARPNDPFDFDNKTILTVLAPFGMGYNPNAVDDPPTSFTDLATARFKGHVGLYDPTSSSFSTLYYKTLEDTYGEQFLHDLAANDPRFYPSSVPMAQAVGAGEVDVTDYVSRSSLTPDLPLEIVFPDKPPSAAIFAAVTAWATHPNAAQVFVNYMMSHDGQEVWAKDQVAMIDGIDTAEFTVDQVSIIGGTPPLATPDEITADTQRYAQIFGL